VKYYSTKDKGLRVGLKEAVLSGMPSDGGLYMPEYIPLLSGEELRRIEKGTLPEIAVTVLQDYVSEDLSVNELEEIVLSAFNFPIPLKEIDENKAVLELFHGPTLAFKDVGARFMSRLMSKLITNDKSGLNIIVATSGDTGSAVANGFYDIEGIRVFILFPSGKVSTLQKKQMTTLGKNIIPLEISGTFDDCQKIVKNALNDKILNSQHRLTTANSINIARLLPQSVYYFKGYYDALKLNDYDEQIIFCVPSGNFGNLCAGLLAKKMGLNIRHFIAATNVNDVVPEYLRSGTFKARKSVQTLSNAMDVGNPSNFERIVDLYDGLYEKTTAEITGFAFSDTETKTQISTTLRQSEYLLDPHGAVGLLALEKYMKDRKGTLYGVSLETAHPSKFIETVEGVIGNAVSIPQRLSDCLNKEEHQILMENDYEKIREFLYEKMI